MIYCAKMLLSINTNEDLKIDRKISPLCKHLIKIMTGYDDQSYIDLVIMNQYDVDLAENIFGTTLKSICFDHRPHIIISMN